jgi:acetyl-CoA carboxylase biotin carboxyl carrier protein
MPKNKLKELIAFAKTTDLQEVIWEQKGVCIRFCRSSVAPAAEASAKQAAQTLASSNGQAPASAVPSEALKPEQSVIRSTMVGTFYRSDSKDRPPLVVEGTLVSAGQPVATVEAMKIRKDVLAPSDCKIIRALVADGHAVEYGQPLFEIEPNDHV